MTARVPWRWFVAGALVLVVGVVVVAWPHASDRPDGLESVARDEGFAGAEAPHPLAATATATAASGGSSSTGRTLSGLAGAGLASVVVVGTLTVLRRRGRARTAGPAG